MSIPSLQTFFSSSSPPLTYDEHALSMLCETAVAGESKSKNKKIGRNPLLDG